MWKAFNPPGVLIVWYHHTCKADYYTPLTDSRPRLQAAAERMHAW